VSKYAPRAGSQSSDLVEARLLVLLYLIRWQNAEKPVMAYCQGGGRQIRYSLKI